MSSESPQVKEAITYTIISLLIVFASMMFGLIGYILRNSSPFAVKMLSFGILGFPSGIIMTMVWVRRWMKRQRADQWSD
jgi:hypothetical protein